jgi:hypothetical protein
MPKETHLPIHDDWRDNFALGCAVARNMSWEQVDVWYILRLSSRSCYAADSAAECYDLTGDFALEGSKNELRLLARCCPCMIKDVEASPVCVV